jgi:hypothetical protein
MDGIEVAKKLTLRWRFLWLSDQIILATQVLQCKVGGRRERTR